MTNLKATTIVQLIREGASLGKKNIEVTFYPAYDKRVHSTLSDSLKQSLKKSKKETFNIITEGIEIIALTKSKDVKTMKWI